jgi:hypothetical protein
MELSKFAATADYFTGKASEVSRQLAFSGIAVVWIFKHGENVASTVPSPLIGPLLLFAASLALDLLHFVYGGIAWSVFRRYHELHKPQGEKDPDVHASRFINWPTWLFFILKIACTLVGYMIVVNFLYSIWVK